ncbi:hypothetical protein CDEST_06312 [Colletotrichum destructivum]|uniref:Uncharacterized protein n=1 Tax=Colletotrichum destructivum TaxID=34406 RepID=A0AAX4IEA3_9PEZI|nr:hypothetical protein CDEST_06312 [Colletotrichum destructivum]
MSPSGPAAQPACPVASSLGPNLNPYLRSVVQLGEQLGRLAGLLRGQDCDSGWSGRYVLASAFYAGSHGLVCSRLVWFYPKTGKREISMLGAGAVCLDSARSRTLLNDRSQLFSIRCPPSGSAENNLDRLRRRIHVVFSTSRHALPTDIHRSPHLACIQRGSPDVRGKYHYTDTLRRYPYVRSPEVLSTAQCRPRQTWALGPRMTGPFHAELVVAR